MIYHMIVLLFNSVFQGNSFRGDKPNTLGIKAEQLTPEVWDYVFFKDAKYPAKCGIKKEALDVMRREFEYW